MKKILLFLLLGVGLSWGIYECRYASTYWMDPQAQPWAYSTDPNALLLPGIWHATVKDPDGLVRKVRMQIFEPHTDAERDRTARRKARKRKPQHRDLRLFHGTAIAKSASGTEYYLVRGSVSESDYHQLELTFRAEDEKKRLPGFNLLLARTGTWHNNSLTLDLEFAWFREDGSSFSDSADPRYSHIEKVTFIRETQKKQ